MKYQEITSSTPASGSKVISGFAIRQADGEANDAAILARLHLALVGYGPVARLGEGFLWHFCYSKLIKEGLISAAIAEVAGEPAGFVAYTFRATTFHRRAIRLYPWAAMRSLMLSVIKDPRALLGILRGIRLMVSRQTGTDRLTGDPSAEVLAFGVLPEFRDRQFVRTTGVRISQRLLDHAIGAFRRQGLSELQAVVDAVNRPTLVFYRMLGATIEPYVQAGVDSRLIRMRIRP